MSLIEDARRIAAAEAPMRADTWCWFCPARLVGYEHFVEATPHEPNCPWLSLPRIVRVLEAAQQMLDYIDITGAEYDSKYGKTDDWWTEWSDLPFVQKLRKAMRDAP